MTAINVVLQRDAVHVITDAAFYDVEGYVRGFAPKAMPVTHWPGVIAMRGPLTGLVTLLAEVSVKFRDIDAFAEGLPAYLPDFCDRHHDVLRAWGGQAALQLIAGGYSTSRGECRAFVASTASGADLSRPDDIDDFEGDAIVMDEGQIVDIPMDQLMMLPLASAADLKAAGVNEDLSVRRLDPYAVKTLGRRVLEAQREIVDSVVAGEELRHLVGGFPCYFTASREGIEASIGEAWGDVVGELITPEKRVGDVSGSPTASMSRQQRRYLERQQRRQGYRAA